MIVFDRAVAASRAFEAYDIAPVVVKSDIRCREGGEYDDGLAAILIFSPLNHGPAQHPFGVADAAVETPSAAHPISALFTHTATGRKEGNGRRWDMPVGEDTIESGLW